MAGQPTGVAWTEEGGGVTGEGGRGLRRLPVVRAVAGRRRFTLEGGGGGQRGAGAGRWGCAGECPRVARWGRSGEGEDFLLIEIVS